MTDERCKQIMQQLGMPESRSLMQALFQVANETEQEVRKKLTIRQQPLCGSGSNDPTPKSLSAASHSGKRCRK